MNPVLIAVTVRVLVIVNMSATARTARHIDGCAGSV